MEKTGKYNKPMGMAFIDYEKAFNSVEIPAVMNAVKKQGAALKYIRMMRNVYRQYRGATVQLHEASEPEHTQRGLKQGDSISPKLFTDVLEQVFRQLKWENNVISVNG